MKCPFCRAMAGRKMTGINLCAFHESKVSERAASFAIRRADALDQLWTMYSEELFDVIAERESEQDSGNGYAAGTIGAETR